MLFQTTTKIGIVAVALLGASLAAAGDELDVKAKLQSTMQLYIEANAVEGVLRVFNPRTKAHEEVELLTAHPKIVSGKDIHVLCYDVVNVKSQRIDIDFYVRRAGESFSVESVVVADHSVMSAALQSGIAPKTKP